MRMPIVVRLTFVVILMLLAVPPAGAQRPSCETEKARLDTQVQVVDQARDALERRVAALAHAHNAVRQQNERLKKQESTLHKEIEVLKAKADEPESNTETQPTE